MADAFGQAFMDYFKGKRNVKVINERDDGFKEKESINHYFTKFNEWPLSEKKATEYVKRRVLDLGCGAGRHLLYLQGKGFKVTGIDVSPHALQVCKKKGAKDVRKMSITTLEFPENTFDTVLLLGNNFGLAGMKTEGLLKKLYKITTKKARIIAQARNPLDTKKQEHLKYHKRNKRKGLPVGLIKLRIWYKGKKTGWFSLLMPTPKEMRKLCKKTGWRIKKLFKKEWIYLLEKSG